MSPESKGALDGIVICDFSWVGAGPIATNVLGQCGAEVIKIESKTRPDILRKGGPFKDGISKGLERSGYFSNRNPNKKGLALNMSLPQAREVAVKLIAKSDIIINNFRTGQMEKWRLGWEDCRAINPRIIYVTMSLQGTEGPHKSYMGFGVNLNALCGLTARASFPGQRPFGTGTNYTDHVMVPCHALFGIMAALVQREQTGLGQTVEVSQLASAISMMPNDPMAYAANGQCLGPLGFGDPHAAPHGVYACLGYRSWIALAVFSEKDWEEFKEAMGRPAWAEDGKFATLEGRKAHEEELNQHVEEWTRWRRAEDVQTELLERGVSAGMVKDARQVIDDAQLKERGYWTYLDHSEVGITLYNRAPIVFSQTPIRMRKSAPLLGENTREVMTGMLGYSTEEVDALSRDGVLA